ncbi:major latex protein 146-like [Papaver somniferum]|uniref:major latex protein 146-like n=1 Tax=Papaver somniferum TaxID=3469 RepID=UPI000E6FFCCF|nr:major latex protein 146-like [Papaver somniferum]
MAQIHRIQVQDEAKNCSADQFYGFLKNERTKYPKLLPLVFKVSKFLQEMEKVWALFGFGNLLWGRGRTPYGGFAGKVNHVGNVIPEIWVTKWTSVTLTEKTEAVDDESMTISFKMTDGDLLRVYTKFEYNVSVTPLVTPGGDKQSCLVKWCLEYEKENEDGPDPTEYVELASCITKAVASHCDKKA